MSGVDLTMTPGLQPPDGHEPQFNAPWNSVQIGCVVAFTVTYFFATVFLGLRYFQALMLIKKVEVDLITVTVSYGIALFYFIMALNMLKYGYGKHLYDVSMAQLLELNKVILPNTLSYLICPTVTKMAILSVLYRINPTPFYRITTIAVAVLIFSYTLVLCIITGGPCSPLKDGTMHCLEKVALWQAILNLISDIAIMGLPIPTIYHLHLPLKQKLTIGCLLALGSGVTLCSIARLPYVIVLPTTPDTTYTQGVLGIWTITEVNLGIICACAMRFKRLLTTYLPKLSLFSSGSRSKTGRKYNSRSAARVQAEGSNRAKGSYQLHSIQKGNPGAVSDVDGAFDNNGNGNGVSAGTGGPKDTVSYTEYQVTGTWANGHRDVERDNGDSGSADRILA